MQKSEYELEREANIARNRALLEELELKQAVTDLGLPSKKKSQSKSQAKPIQPTKKPKREKSEVSAPRRTSARLRGNVVDPNESPSTKRKREAEEMERRAKEAEERLEVEERERIAKRPRHHELKLSELADGAEADELSGLTTTLQTICEESQPKHVGDPDAFSFDSDGKDEIAVAELREKLQNMKIVARAKVTANRIYSAAYHPDVTKDLIFFGDKHGELGIWDARAPPDEVADEDEEIVTSEDKEGGKYWRLQLHWPATAKSSISCVKFDPINSHNVYTSAYDCTIRSLAFTSGVSREIFSTDNVLICSIDISPSGHEMWISDAEGSLTHLDLREDKFKARAYGLSDLKIGSVSINPTHPHILLTASNDRTLKMWDSRKLQSITGGEPELTLLTPPPSSPEPYGDSDVVQSPMAFDQQSVREFIESKQGTGSLRSEWRHDKSVSSAYWDPRGRGIVSTSYDNSLRLWDINASSFRGSEPLRSFRPFSRVTHNCQTGKWLTILRAQWTPNPDVYPHFTIGNMDHSLDIFSCKGDVIARLSDREKITAVQAVTCSHPNVLERAASGNASGRCILWAPPE